MSQHAIGRAHRRSAWAPVTVNGAAVLAIMILVAVVALVVKPPAPPGIAAFAPQASKQITKAPQAQTSINGQGAGKCGAAQVCAGAGKKSPSPAPSATTVVKQLLTTGVPSSLQCYTWPDGSVTQTFDPQSPPCIAGWDDKKGNGGATSTGVSATTIRVALPVSATSTWPSIQPIENFFNTRFQMYGRKIQIVPVSSGQATGDTDGKFDNPQQQHADAASIAQQKPFASLSFVDPIEYSWAMPEFYSYLAQHKIVTMTGGETTPYATTADLAKYAPYVWSYVPTIDQLMGQLATVACKQLVGKTADHAGDASLRKKVRKFAIAVPDENSIGGPIIGMSTLKQGLAGCGVTNVDTIVYSMADSQRGALTAEFRQLQSKGVTSIFNFPWGGTSTSNNSMSIADGIAYHPEWVFIGWNEYMSAFNLNQAKDQTAHAFGVGVWNKMPVLPLEFWNQAYFAGGGNSSASDSGALDSGRGFYNELLMLASGIQEAGPNLTPASFAQGLHTTEWSNPGAGTTPYYQATVGFPGSSATMIQDYNEFWLDNRVSGQHVESSKNINSYDAVCYADLGLRWADDGWNKDDSFYSGGCR